MAPITIIDDLAGLRALAQMLPDTPETVISLHLLQRGLCRAWVAGPLDRPVALVIDSDEAPGEPSCHGDDPDAIWSILRDLPGWFAANMREAVAPAVATIIEQEWGERVSYLGDPHFTLQRPAPQFSDPVVRRLGPADVALLDAAPAEVRGGGFGGTTALLSNGIVAAAIVDGGVVAIAHTSAITDRHADIGVVTLPDYRRRGFATAAAALVATAIQASGRVPVWSCGETNQASLHVAANLGFAPILRRVYTILDSRRPGER
jgi:GNAT superfamily N-acetyltransferase